MGAWRPKHVEWPCRNKTCTVLHQVGVSFDVYYDARKHKIKMWIYLTIFICSVGIGTRHRLQGPGIEFHWGWDFTHPHKIGPGTQPAFCTMGNGSFPGAKRPGRGVTTYSHRSPRLKKELSYKFTTPLGLLLLYVMGWVYVHPHQGSCCL